jgi:hypothetical protein
MAIVACLDKLIEDAEAASDLIKTAGYRVRAHKILHVAQEASSQRSLLSQDWHDEDIQRRAA